MKGSRALGVLLVVALTLGVRAFPALKLGNEGPDFENYRQMGAALKVERKRKERKG